jgi:membrane fusion protein (multidrug efflux system)
MTRHESSFDIERSVSSDEADALLRAAIAATPREPSEPVARQSDAQVDAAPQESQQAAAPATPKRNLRRLLLAGGALAVLAAAGWYGDRYWTTGRFEVSTDDAYVKADNTTIAPKISGYIGEVLVGDNQTVKAGQVLARIDDRDFRVALQQVSADVASARANVAMRQASLAAQQPVIDAARASVAVDEANATFAAQENRRYSQLATTGYGSVQSAQQAASRIGAANAAVSRDKATLANALKQVEVLTAELSQAQATVARGEAAENQAKLNLSYTAIVAPVDGVVGNRSLRIGQYVQAGTQLMAVVPTDQAYVIANYKETQLTNVRPGQPVAIEVDMFPGITIRGHVDSIAPASGQEFALLPPDNATGNFTKVVQRIPVKIILESGNGDGILRPGMSVNPTVDTKLRQPQIAGTLVRQG